MNATQEIAVPDGNGNITLADAATLQGCTVKFHASNCTLKIGRGSKLQGLELNFYRPGQTIEIGEDCTIRGQAHLKGERACLKIGARTKVNGSIWLNIAEADTNITIGEECLFASVRFRPADSHRIIDIATGKRLNPPADIVIGDRVWLAEDVLVLKGVTIGSGTIVGARSMVTRDLPSNVLAAGSPAKVIREGVRWEE